MILCLLVSFKSFSQKDIQSKDSVVVLTESQSRQVIKDLIKYDFLKKTTAQYKLKINNLLSKETNYLNLISVKDNIILTQKEYISKQEEVINFKKPLEFHGYIGIQTLEMSLQNITMYGQMNVEFEKFNVGVRLFNQVNSITGYGLVFEYKLF